MRKGGTTMKQIPFVAPLSLPLIPVFLMALAMVFLVNSLSNSATQLPNNLPPTTPVESWLYKSMFGLDVYRHKDGTVDTELKPVFANPASARGNEPVYAFFSLWKKYFDAHLEAYKTPAYKTRFDAAVQELLANLVAQKKGVPPVDALAAVNAPTGRERCYKILSRHGVFAELQRVVGPAPIREVPPPFNKIDPLGTPGKQYVHFHDVAAGDDGIPDSVLPFRICETTRDVTVSGVKIDPFAIRHLKLYDSDPSYRKLYDQTIAPIRERAHHVDPFTDPFGQSRLTRELRQALVAAGVAKRLETVH